MSIMIRARAGVEARGKVSKLNNIFMVTISVKFGYDWH